MDEVEKIVKALRYCDSEEWTDCEKCVRFGECYEDHRSVDADAADMIERLSAELEKAKRERDAAVNDIPRACGYCKHFKTDVECCDIPGCCDNPDCWNISGVNSGWEWRGVCEENSGGVA